MSSYEKKTCLLTAVCCFLAIFTSSCYSEDADNYLELHKESLKVKSPERWEKKILEFIDSDANCPPPQNAVLFVGSSSIVGWDTQKWFSETETINRGFGGSYICDSVYYADKIILPYNPKTIVFYAGDNDIADNKSPEMLLADFKALVSVIRRSLGETRIIVIATKPSIDRWKFWPKMKEANSLISNYCDSQPEIFFVDVSTVMLDETGYPRKDLFKADGLHINEQGYELWTSLVKPLIEK